ncbi:hypothetical protein JCM15124A_13180 [Prevotella falsenii]
MYVEIDSTDIIAFLIKRSGFSNEFEIPFSLIHHLAKVIESENEDILTFCDSVSIDAFRCAFTSNVVVEHSTIKIYNARKIRTNVERLLPPQRIMDLLEDINKR